MKARQSAMSVSNSSSSSRPLPSSRNTAFSATRSSAPGPNGDIAPVRIRSSLRRGGNLLLDLPIAGRLTLGFLTAALIATLAAGLVGILRSQSLSRQSDFYQNLLQSNSSLNTGANFLELMNSETDVVLNVATQQTSQETLASDQHAIRDLSSQYDQILSIYFSSSLVSKHADEIALLQEANHIDQINQQSTLAGSAVRTWQLYRTAQEQILQDIANNHLEEAQTLLHVQGEPTNADAQSALRSLIQFDQRLAKSIREAGSIEQQQQIITTILGALLAFFLIAMVGWLISGTLVKRLKQLRRITRLVENGQLDARVTVIGRDEIADVSASINAMLDAIVGLINETRSQKDALTNAAEHLFTDMRVVSAGDLRVNTPVSNDPIGMLANAFNFTVGRFRRFVLRTQSTIEQIEVISRQEIERADTFAIALTNATTSIGLQSGQNQAATGANAKGRMENGEQNSQFELQEKALFQQMQTMREKLRQQRETEGFARHTRAILGLTEQISLVVNKLSKAITNEERGLTRAPSGSLAQMHLQELRTLETMLQRLTVDLQGVQQNTAKNLLNLDNGLAQFSEHLQASRQTSANNILTNHTKEIQLELIRQGQSFAGDVTVLTRRLTALAQEMRTGALSFQLDTSDSGTTFEMGNNQHPLFSGSISQGGLLDGFDKTPPSLTVRTTNL
jgi:HAMP domain-containing protein